MVGFEPTQEEIAALPSYAHSIAGAASGIVTRCLAQPLDVVKIRFQLQAEPISRTSSTSKYRSFTQACQTIYAEEGLRSFWKGHVTAQMLSISYGIVQFASFEMLTKVVGNKMPRVLSTDYRPVSHLVCGSLSGCCATVASYPFDVLRTRFVAQGEPRMYRTVRNAYINIATTDGYRGFYRGLWPNMLHIAPYSGLQFGFYSLFVELWEDVKPRTLPLPGFVESLTCGALAGLCSKLAVYPMDLLKKRLQVQGWEGRGMLGRTYIYTGLIHGLRAVWRGETWRGFYKGLSVSLLKSVTVASISFAAYEQCCNLFIRLSAHVT